jgi:CRP/FNR family transcriptional regulator
MWRRRPAGQSLYVMHDAASKVWVVATGWIHLVVPREDGTDRVLGYRSAGDVLGAQGLFDTRTYTHNANALDALLCLEVDCTSLQKLIKDHPLLAFELGRQVAVHVEQQREDLANISIVDFRRRLLRSVVTLGQRHGQVDDNNVCHLPMPMSRLELSRVVGVTPPSIGRNLGDVPNVHIERNHLTVSDWDAFCQSHA